MRILLSTMFLWFSCCLALQADPLSRELTVPGPVELGATLELPDKTGLKYPGIVLMHGSGPNDRDCSMPIGLGGIHPFRHLSRELAERGFVVLRYDKRSYAIKPQGYSEAAIRSLTPGAFVDDAVSAIKLLASQPEVDPKQLYLIGHSQGGSLAPYVADKTNLAGVVMLAPALLSFRDQIEYQLNYQTEVLEKKNRFGLMSRKLKNMEKIRKQYQAVFKKVDAPEAKDDDVLGGATVRFFRQSDSMGKAFVSKVQKLSVPSLLVNGTEDLKCPEPLLRTKQKQLEQNPTLKIVVIDGMNHELYRNNYLQFDMGPVEAITEWVAGLR